MTLLDLFRAYPGGVAQLSRDTGVGVHTLYRLGRHSHRRRPSRVIDKLGPVFARREILGRTYDAVALLRVWEAQ